MLRNAKARTRRRVCGLHKRWGWGVYPPWIEPRIRRILSIARIRYVSLGANPWEIAAMNIPQRGRERERRLEVPTIHRNFCFFVRCCFEYKARIGSGYSQWQWRVFIPARSLLLSSLSDTRYVSIHVFRVSIAQLFPVSSLFLFFFPPPFSPLPPPTQPIASLSLSIGDRSIIRMSSRTERPGENIKWKSYVRRVYNPPSHPPSRYRNTSSRSWIFSVLEIRFRAAVPFDRRGVF